MFDASSSRFTAPLPSNRWILQAGDHLVSSLLGQREPLLGLVRVVRCNAFEQHTPATLSRWRLDPVPDPSASGELALPADVSSTVPHQGSQTTFELSVGKRRRVWRLRQVIPRIGHCVNRCCAEITPALFSLPSREDHLILSSLQRTPNQTCASHLLVFSPDGGGAEERRLAPPASADPHRRDRCPRRWPPRSHARS